MERTFTGTPDEAFVFMRAEARRTLQTAWAQTRTSLLLKEASGAVVDWKGLDALEASQFAELERELDAFESRKRTELLLSCRPSAI